MKNITPYQATCTVCGKIFTAYKTTTKYCGKNCSRRAIKIEYKNNSHRLEEIEKNEKVRLQLSNRSNLSLSLAATFLGVSRPTLYKLLTEHQIELLRISQRTIRVRVSDLEKLYSKLPVKITPKTAPIEEIGKILIEYVTSTQAAEKFNISKSFFYKKIKEKNISPVLIDKQTLYPLKSLKKLFVSEHKNITDWYTLEDIAEKYNMAKTSVYGFVCLHSIPRKKVGLKVMYSKKHLDSAKGTDPVEKVNYYTVAEAIKKYKFTRSYLYGLVRERNIPKLKKGNFNLIHRQTLDDIMNTRTFRHHSKTKKTQ
jgi:excisionase family DNA binding protein